MKPLYRILLTVVCLPLLFAACSLTSLIREESRLEQVRVYLADGSIIEGKAKLPDLQDKTIRIVAEGKGRKHIKADKIKALAFRRENTEGRRDIFLYSKYKKADMVLGPFWMKLEGSGPHLSVMAYADDFQFNACGHMLLVGEQIRYYFFKGNDGRGYNVASKGYANSVPLARSEIMDFLSDDSDLCKAIEEKRIEPFEFDVICETFSGKRYGRVIRGQEECIVQF